MLNKLKMKGAIFNGTQSAKKGSIEKCTLQALLCVSMPQNEISSILLLKLKMDDHTDEKEGKLVSDNDKQKPICSSVVYLHSIMGDTEEDNEGILIASTQCLVIGCLQRKIINMEQ